MSSLLYCILVLPKLPSICVCSTVMRRRKGRLSWSVWVQIPSQVTLKQGLKNPICTLVNSPCMQFFHISWQRGIFNLKSHPEELLDYLVTHMSLRFSLPLSLYILCPHICICFRLCVPTFLPLLQHWFYWPVW